MHRRTLLHSIRNSWNGVLSVEKHVPQGESTPGNKARNCDLSTLASCKAQSHAETEAITVMTQLRINDQSDEVAVEFGFARCVD
jgi:hypothetical protein